MSHLEPNFQKSRPLLIIIDLIINDQQMQEPSFGRELSIPFRRELPKRLVSTIQLMKEVPPILRHKESIPKEVFSFACRSVYPREGPNALA